MTAEVTDSPYQVSYRCKAKDGFRLDVDISFEWINCHNFVQELHGVQSDVYSELQHFRK